MRRLAALALVVGCVASSGRARERCYAEAEAAARRRVDVECSGTIATCPVGDAIAAELVAARAACL